MHDISAARAIVDTVLQAAAERQAKRIDGVRLELGAMTMLDPEQLEFWTHELLRGTIGEEAAIEITQRSLVARCGSCGYEGPIEVPDDPIYHLMPFTPTCPECGATELELLTGQECVVESIRVQT